MSISDLRKAVESLELGSPKWDFFNALMEICAKGEILGSQLIFVYAMIIVGYREYGQVGWGATSLGHMVGSTNNSISVFMHMTEHKYCTMWATIYCRSCNSPVVSSPILGDMSDFVLNERCPFCRGPLEDRFYYYVFDPKKIPWEINVPFHPYVRYDDASTRPDRDPGRGVSGRPGQ